MARRDHAGLAKAGTEAKRPSRRKRPQRMHNLIAALDRVVPWRDAHLDTVVDRLRMAQEVADKEPRHQQRQTGHCKGYAIACNSIQQQEETREDKRRSEILLKEKESEHQYDRDENGQNVL